jgi:hypothetical protein
MVVARSRHQHPRVREREGTRIGVDVFTKPSSGMHVDAEPLPEAKFVRVDVDPVVHRPAILAVLVDTAAGDALVVLRQPEVDADPALGESCARSSPIAK